MGNQGTEDDEADEEEEQAHTRRAAALTTMSTGTLDLLLTDLRGDAVKDITVTFTRVSGEAGSGGETQHVTLVGPDTDLRITGITCRGGPGTIYRVQATADHYRPYAFSSSSRRIGSTRRLMTSSSGSAQATSATFARRYLPICRRVCAGFWTTPTC